MAITSMIEKGDSQESRDRQAKLITRFLDSAKNIEAFGGKQVGEVFSGAESIRAFIGRLSQEEFSGLLNGINGILRGKPKEKWGLDGAEVFLESPIMGQVIPPREQDKLELLEETFRGVKTMNQEGRGLDDIALLLSSSINEVHPYLDANGRTSRLIYILLTEGYNSESKKVIANVLGEYGRDYVDIDPGLINRQILDIIISELRINDEENNPRHIGNWLNEGSFDDLKFQTEVPEEQKQGFIKLLRSVDDYLYVFFALFKHLHGRPDLEKYVKQYPKRQAIILEKLIPEMTPADLDQITENYWKIKRRHSEILIDCIVNPQKAEYVVEDNEEKVSLAEYFKESIKEEATRR